ncbi:MAG: LCP family protein [Fimbriimonadaceae bacterium]|nr:LCP family protein [Chthonomonadaceae bacterium]MCO5296902.1 LCP family protein [Fimbriimonadaceae bacterium]
MSVRKTRPTPRWYRVLGILYYTVFCAVILAGAALAHWVTDSEVLRAGIVQTFTQKAPEDVFTRDTVTLLVLGCDEDRAYGGKQVLRTQARSDMMLVARLDFKKNRISGVTIPRDLLVRVPGYRNQKINAYHSIGGADLAKKAAEQVLGVPIDKVVTIDYEALQKMVDLIGGVEVFVEKRMKWTDKRGGLFIDLQPGKQKLDGYNAMCYVRFRHSDSDFARSERQKNFLLSFKEAALGNPSNLNRVADQAVKLLGGGLNPSEVAALAMFARKVSADNIKFGTVPVLPASNYNLELDTRLLPKTLEEYHLLEDRATTVTYGR